MSLKTGDKLTLTIHDLAFGGEGVGRVGAESKVESRESKAGQISTDAAALDPRPSTLDNFVVFVPFVLPGEIVEA